MSERCTLQTRRFGPLEYHADQVLHLPHGIVPFVWAGRFVMLSRPDEWPFSWLQSLDDPRLAFAVAPLEMLFPADAAQMHACLPPQKPGTSRRALYGIVVLDADPAKLTINLLAPIVVDPDSMTAEQIVLDRPLELARHPLAPALQQLAAA